MTSRRPVLLLSLLLAATAVRGVIVKPASVIQEQKLDAQQVLLVRTTDNGTVTDILQMECGTDRWYETSAIVLGVNRTVEPSATAIGAENEGRVMTHCDTLEFKTFERDWINYDECDDTADPGRKWEGTCGYVYLTPGMEDTDPYSFAVTGKKGFEEVDGSICERAMKEHCPEYVAKDAIFGDEPASGSNDQIATPGSDGGEEGKSAKNGGVGSTHLGNYVLVAAFLSAFWQLLCGALM